MRFLITVGVGLIGSNAVRAFGKVDRGPVGTGIPDRGDSRVRSAWLTRSHPEVRFGRPATEREPNARKGIAVATG